MMIDYSVSGAPIGPLAMALLILWSSVYSAALKWRVGFVGIINYVACCFVGGHHHTHTYAVGTDVCACVSLIWHRAHSQFA